MLEHKKVHCNKLTIAEVQDIRRLVDEGWTCIWGGQQLAHIAAAYNITPNMVGLIGNRRHWFWLVEYPGSPFA